ncbi:MAG: hypothetical protein J6R47_03160, partial [Acholeplasmatales bacterium]|nr:hypothetical protein [Acholeplasmatales bacterium]
KDIEELQNKIKDIKPCECDKEWMRFMKSNFEKGSLDNSVNVKGELNLSKGTIQGLSSINNTEGELNINCMAIKTDGLVSSKNLPKELSFIYNNNSQFDSVPEYIKEGEVIEYNTYGKWYQPCDIETFGSIDVDNRLRINTLENKKIVKTLDVGANIEDHEIRISSLENSGGGGSGVANYWKINPTHMESLPEHYTLDTYDYRDSAKYIKIKKLEDDTQFIYFPGLTIDNSFDRHEFIEIMCPNPRRTWYLTTKNNKLIVPKIIDHMTMQEEFVETDLNEIGILWQNQRVFRETTINCNIETIPIYFKIWFTLEGGETIEGTDDKPNLVTIKLYNANNENYSNLEFNINRSLDNGDDPIEGIVKETGESCTLNATNIREYSSYTLYYINGLDLTQTTKAEAIYGEFNVEISVNDYLVNPIKNNTISFRYTPDRDKIYNNEPISITSTEIVNNQTSIIAPNTMDYHKYGGIIDYEIRLDKLLDDTESHIGFHKITFKDFDIGGDYEGPIFTIYFGTTKFMMNNEAIMKPISCYYEDGKFYTDKFFKQNGYWMCEKLEVDTCCFLWDNLAPLTLIDAYNIGEITIKYIPRQSTLSTKHDIICKEVFADNAMNLYKSATPNFYNP